MTMGQDDAQDMEMPSIEEARNLLSGDCTGLAVKVLEEADMSRADAQFLHNGGHGGLSTERGRGIDFGASAVTPVLGRTYKL